MDFTVSLAGAPFDLDYTLESGQVFRWENAGEWWVGHVGGGILKVKQEGDSLQCIASDRKLDSAFVRRYFRLDENLVEVLASIRKDETITTAIQRFYGLRLIRQDPWECLLSFVLATNSNIPRIRGMVANVCRKYGESLEFEGTKYRAFPDSGSLSEAGLEDLTACGLGYRAKFVMHVSKAVQEGKLDLSELLLLDYEPARQLLLRKLFEEKLLLGVGPKVADCVLLFSCDKDEAFPIDVWIGRALLHYYPKLLPKAERRRIESRTTRSLGRRVYEILGNSARAYFGTHAGYAQQYLFMYARAEAA